jgi:hypothetical protein
MHDCGQGERCRLLHLNNRFRRRHRRQYFWKILRVCWVCHNYDGTCLRCWHTRQVAGVDCPQLHSCYHLLNRFPLNWLRVVKEGQMNLTLQLGFLEDQESQE